MDRFAAMAMLVEAVERGSLSAAGRSLNVPLPTLSRRIGELESLVGAKLLIRTTRKLALTEAGLTYLQAARRILEQVQDAEHEAAGEFVIPKGELIVTAPVLFGRRNVLPLVADFLATHPLIDIRLLLSDGNANLIDDRVDLGVRIGPLPDSGLVATRLGSMRTVVCASPALIARYGCPASPADLARWPVVTLGAPSPYPGWLFPGSDTLGSAGAPLRTRLFVTTAEAAVEAGKRSVGAVRLLFYQVADAVADRSLEVVLAPFEPEPVPVHAVHIVRGQMPLKLRRFLDFAVPRLRQQLRALADNGAGGHD